MNRVASTTNALGQKTTYTYDADGNQTEKKDYLGNRTKQVYDGINRLVEVRDAYDKVVQQILYNAADAQISSFDALHHETRYSYDKNLRNTGTTDGEGNTSSMTYDTRGNVSTKTDANGNTTSYQYDGENHLIKVSDALGNSTSYTYDVAGNMISQTDGNGNTTTYRYNAANLKAAKQDPADADGNPGRLERYTYTANEKMATKLDRNGITTTYTYDAFGRLLNEDADGEVQSYTYDANGNLLTMTDATGKTTRTYDALNRNTTKTVPGIGKSTYEYDLPAQTAGEYCERTTDPKGNVNIKTYDKVGRLSEVTVGNDVTGYEYYANGSQHRVTYPDGTTETYSYDKDNRITELNNTKADGTILSSYRYAYDAAGNQTSKQEAKGTTTYTYDKLNRLATVTEPDSKLTSYTYDPAGNRKSERVEKGLLASTTLYTYDTLNRLTSTSSSDGVGTTYLYDANGNLLSRSSGENKVIDPEKLTRDDLPDFGLVIRRDSGFGTGSKDLTTYTYDNYNRLTATKSENTSAAYAYNAQGYRVEKKVNNKVTQYLYEADKVVLETDENGAQTAYQIYGNSLIYRSAAGDNGQEEGCYYLYNAHGDVTGLLDAQGNMAATYDYDAFGNILSETGAADNSTKYAGYQYDKESGLYYLNARYYDSVTARFITEDTYTGQQNDPLSLNLYTYCANNPILYIDPSGHKVQAIKKGSTGEDVEFIQQVLVKEGYDLGKTGADGNFGSKTKAAVIQYQKDHNLKADGIVGVNTYSSLLTDSCLQIVEDINSKKESERVDQLIAQSLLICAQAIENVQDAIQNTITEINSALKQALDQAAKEKEKDLRDWAFITGMQNFTDGLAMSYGTRYIINEKIPIKGVSNGVGKLTGSLDGLTAAEKRMANDLLNQGKNVEIIPRSNVQGVKTPDFYVNGVKTELKTLSGTSLNTPVTRIQDGFKQGASTVIIDGRESGLSLAQANTVMSRINGIYNNKVPGKVEIWTKSGTVYGGK